MQKSTEHNARTSQPIETGHETILIIDDDTDLLMLNRTILEMEDYEVFTAQSGTEALALLNEIPLPQLILLDMKMAEMSGMDFLKKLEQERPEIVETVPVVFMTGVDQVPASKAAGFIRKPTELSQFIKSVRNFIDADHIPPSVQH